VWVSPEWVPKGRRPRPGLLSYRECLNSLARCPRAKRWAPQMGVGGVPGAVPVTSETREREREQAALREGDTY
jgi:hypothetical protein